MPSLAFTFQTTTSEKIIQLDLVSGVINVNVIDGDLEYQPSFSELSNYITLASDPYYTEGLFYISDFSICYEFNGFSNLGALNLGSYSIELNHNTMGTINGISYSGSSDIVFLESGNGNRTSFYPPSYFYILNGTSSGTVDLVPVFTAISLAKADILNSVSGIDFSSIINHITSSKTEILNNVPFINLSNSLNGVGCEFKDGSFVMVDGRDTVFEVKRSSFFLLEDKTYTALYDLESPTGETVSCPESLLTRYSVPVTTP